MIAIQPRQRSAVKGYTFGARKDSCSCDPCDCNPCNCGDSLTPDYPDWRVSGYCVKSGAFEQQQLAGCILLALAQPEQEGSYDHWQEVILVDSEATSEQIHALLALFEADLDSMPAEVGVKPEVKRAVYNIHMEYRMTEKGPYLQAVFQPDPTNLVREGSIQQELRPWSYDGPMVLRGNFHNASI